MPRRGLSLFFWLAAVVLTIALAAFQRVTGPTYPLRGNVQIGSDTVHYRLLRSHESDGDLPVQLAVPDCGTGNTLQWRRYPTNENWRKLPLNCSTTGGQEMLEASIPRQPPAGKVEYRLVLPSKTGEPLIIPEGEPAIARFKGPVSALVLVPHILAMFFSMLFATRALFEVLRREAEARNKVITAMVLLFVGGLVLGPIVQKYAFGSFWTGWPLGGDFTDNKTLFAFLAWLPATWLAFRRRRLRWPVILGWVVMMGIFLVPHSFLGSQLDWTKIPEP